MNYKNIYIEKTPEELVQILEKIDELSYEAKTALYEYLEEKPPGLTVDESKLNELKSSFQAEDEDIINLNHVSNLGLKIDGAVGEFVVRRSGSAIIVDVIGIVVGIVLMSKFISAYDGWNEIMETGIAIMAVVWASINTIIAIFGLVLFTKAMNRFLAFMSFRIEKNNDKVIITMRQDLGKSIFEINKEDIGVAKEGGSTILSFNHNNSKHTLLKSNEGRVLQNTISSLALRLKE